MKTCAPSTHASHATVAYSGNARNCLTRSIHAPGRGSRLRQPGNHASSTYGSAMPAPSATNTASVTPTDCEIA